MELTATGGTAQGRVAAVLTGCLHISPCRETTTVDQFLRGIMRSIAYTARRSRERRGEHHVGFPVEDLVERMALRGYVVQSAKDIIETERVRQLCADVLEQLAATSKIQAALIEGISLDLRGQDLTDDLGITLPELGTVRARGGGGGARPDVWLCC